MSEECDTTNTRECTSLRHSYPPSSLSKSTPLDKPFKKTVRFNNTLEQRSSQEEKSTKMNDGGRRSDTESKTDSQKNTNAAKPSVNVFNNDAQVVKGSNVKKGTCAKFLRQNPRFVNEPICQVLPNESSGSVGECLSWCTPTTTTDNLSTVSTTINGRSVEREKSSKCRSDKVYNSTCHSTYLPPPNKQRPHPLQKHHPSPKVDGIAPLINEQQQVVKERISYSHQYNSRADPNEPIRGKLHGSFVWEPQRTTDMSSGLAQPRKQ